MRRTIVGTLAAAGLVATGLVAGAQPATAAAECNSDTAIFDTTIPTSIVVPAGGLCLLQGVHVKGSITVKKNAVLVTEFGGSGPTVVDGSISASNALVEILEETEVAGSVQLLKPRIPPDSVAPDEGDFISGVVSAICDSHLKALQILDARPNDAPLPVGGAECTGLQPQEFGAADGGNTIDSSVTVKDNRVEVQIFDNLVGGALSCARNNPPPIGGGNEIAGTTGGQCALGFES